MKAKMAKKLSSLVMRQQLYKAYQAIGATICPNCRDYVMKDGHDCERYQIFRDKGITR